MTSEEKQALIEHAKSWIANAEEARDEMPFGFDEGAENELSLIRVALAALTAQPVKLPESYFCDRNSGNEDFMPLHDTMLVKSQVITAIRAAGYEVKE